MALSVTKSTNVKLAPMTVMLTLPVLTLKVPSLVLVMMVSTAMVYLVIISTNVPEVLITVTLTPTVSIPWVDLNVNVKMDSKVMVSHAEISTNVLSITHVTVQHHAVILKVVSNVLAKLDLLVMDSTVLM